MPFSVLTIQYTCTCHSMYIPLNVQDVIGHSLYIPFNVHMIRCKDHSMYIRFNGHNSLSRTLRRLLWRSTAHHFSRRPESYPGSLKKNCSHSNMHFREQRPRVWTWNLQPHLAELQLCNFGCWWVQKAVQGSCTELSSVDTQLLVARLDFLVGTVVRVTVKL